MKQPWLISALGVLVALNLTLLFFLWRSSELTVPEPIKERVERRMRPQGGEQAAHRPGMNMQAMMMPQVERFLVNQLNFTEAQKAQVRELRKVNQQKGMKHHVKIMEFKAAALAMSVIDGAEENQAAVLDSIAVYVKRNEQVVIDHFRQMRALCDESQRSQFDMAMLNASARMRNESRRRSAARGQD